MRGRDYHLSGLHHRGSGVEHAFQGAREVLPADRLPGLLGDPGRERAPVGARPRACRECRRQLVVALRDPQVTYDRVTDSRDVLHLGNPWYWTVVRVATHGLRGSNRSSSGKVLKVDRRGRLSLRRRAERGEGY